MEQAKKIVAFAESYDRFSETLLYGELNLKIHIPHRWYVSLLLPSGKRAFIGTISSLTPKTYYAGARRYGKYLFLLPPGVRVVRREVESGSNAAAEKDNNALLRVPAAHATSIGFDLYEVRCTPYGETGEGVPFVEVATRVETFEIDGFGMLWKEAFIQNAMPANLPEIIPGFPYQCSGWKRNSEESYLFAVKKIGETRCNILFASGTPRIPPIEGVEMEYIRPINGPN